VAAPEELERMQAYLAERNDPRIIEDSIDLGNSEIVDCITATLQHGFDHPIILEKPPERGSLMQWTNPSSTVRPNLPSKRMAQ
jgi:hypothetical protein